MPEAFEHGSGLAPPLNWQAPFGILQLGSFNVKERPYHFCLITTLLESRPARQSRFRARSISVMLVWGAMYGPTNFDWASQTPCKSYAIRLNQSIEPCTPDKSMCCRYQYDVGKVTVISYLLPKAARISLQNVIWIRLDTGCMLRKLRLSPEIQSCGDLHSSRCRH